MPSERSIISLKIKTSGCSDAKRQEEGYIQKRQRQPLPPENPAFFHGMKSYFCQDEYGQIAPVYSISAGLDYPGIGPEHADLYDKGRAEYVAVTDDEAVNAFEYLSRTEGSFRPLKALMPWHMP